METLALEILNRQGGVVLSRWGHVLAGVTWIGLLYYFNFVQTPAFAEFEAAARTEAIRKLVPRALWWFRWGALLTVLTGLSILVFEKDFSMGYFKTPPGISIATGILMALIMFVNVWGIIWPNQKVVIANAEATAAGQEALPNAAAAGRKASCASRTNAFFSIPMVFFMVATSHFAPIFKSNPSGASRLIYWLVVIVLVGAVEYVGFSAPAVGKPLAWHIDKHRNTIIGGFAFWFILLMLFQVSF